MLYQEKLWQENYYEHVLRKDEDTKSIVKYIFENPIRKGLSCNILNYPYSGSFEFTLDEF
ncbi:hypothetical protein HY745_13835 [Candidatus Desantisbacteria bacterium]|nr:hypothetical protein [Candidatus Desantisbacteria bacterium]